MSELEQSRKLIDALYVESSQQIEVIEQLRQRVKELEEQAAENNHHLQVEVESFKRNCG